jgi:hypothetical protein
MHPSPSPRRAALAALLCLSLAFAGAGVAALRPAEADAQGPVPASQQAILDTVRELTGEGADLTVQQRPDGSYFANTRGTLQAVLLAATNADGEVLTRCVETIEEAAAFLAEAPTLRSAAAFEPEGGVEAVRASLEANPALMADALAANGTQFRIIVGDGAGEGFNDPTPAAPVGGNSGTTVGQQRLKAFEYAAAIWATFLQSTVPIEIEAEFNPLTCNASGGVLGSAGPQSIHRDFRPAAGSPFPGAEQPQTWYVQALANQRMGADIGGVDSTTGQPVPDIFAQFNSDVGKPACIAGSGWYYGFDGNEGGKIDLVVVLLHEFGHGLGFLSLVNGNTGANFSGFNDIWNYYLAGSSGGAIADTLWRDLTATQRATSARSNNLVWNGANTNFAAARLYGNVAPRLTASPASGGPYSGSAASFGPAFTDTPVSGALVAATDADEDGAATRYTGQDACSAITNAAAVAGKVALVSRGPCAYNAQVRNLQAAGAIAAVIADNVADSAAPLLDGADTGVTIPSMTITQAAGSALRSSLGAGAVNASIAIARTSRGGFDSLGRAKMYAPSTFQPGSSVSHFDTGFSSPNLLMEPAINADITQNLDLTEELMQDIGWFPDRSFNGIDDRRELNLGVTLTAPSGFVRPSQPFTLTLTVRNQGFTTAGVTLAAAFPATYGSPAWTAAYTGGAAGPAAGSGPINAPLTLTPGSSAVFTIVATAPAAGGPLGAATATITRVGGATLVDTSGAGDDSAALGLIATDGTVRFTYLPLTKK